MNRLAHLLVLLVAVMLAGCSVITRPPSAAAFMNSYRDESVTDVNFAMYGGDLVLNESKRTDYEVKIVYECGYKFHERKEKYHGLGPRAK